MLPLSGIRIIAVEQYGAGPHGTMFLADLGAEVIKIENHAERGEMGRHVGPHFFAEGDSHFFQSLNRNKRSVCLNLKVPEARGVLHDLVRHADGLLDNLRGDQPEKLGLDYASLREVNPAIVCLHISAYGRDNTRKSWPGYDYLMQAEAGLMSLTGEPDGPPARFGPSVIDFMTGITGIVGLLSCVLRARQTGRGGDVDTCLFDVALHQLSYPGTWHLNGGEMPTRAPRGAHLAIAPVQTFRTADGWIYVMCMTDKFWQALLERIGRPELGADPRFADQAARREHRAALAEVLEAEFVRKPTAAWLERLAGVIPVAPVNDVAQALANPFLAQVDMVRGVPHPAKRDFRLLANPLRIDGQRPSQRACSALGADNATLLGGRPPRKASEG
jgi:crotonobetainyl-CoA:carnitine CoA-transferase CaiB-like acyl-CoA transferase